MGFNQIETIGERAFVGLEKLQVLELNNNNLKQIHSNAFIPLRASIYDLNLANNNKLTSITSLGLEQLLSLKAYGNEQLRQLPLFRSAKSLALTYAYHCCDYMANNRLVSSSALIGAENQNVEFGADPEPEPALMKQLIKSILNKLVRFFSQDGKETTESNISSHPNSLSESAGINVHLERSTRRRENPLLELEPANETLPQLDNFTEFILWPQVDLKHRHHQEQDRIRKRHHQRIDSSLEANNVVAERILETKAGSRTNNHHSGFDEHLIDDSQLWKQVRQIRLEHNVWWPMRGEQASLIVADRIGDMDDNNHFLAHLGHMNGRQKRHLAEFQDSDKRAFKEQLQASSTTQVSCLPKPSAFLPCQDLFDTWWLRVGIWSVFLLAFTGNLLVIIVLSSVRPSSASSALTSIMWLAHSKRHIDVPRFLVINLAVADLLMAVYLGLLAFVDLSTLGEFKLFAIKWQYSSGCKLAGFLGVLSSELSVFILAIITLERNYAITNAVHLNRRLSLQKAMIIMFVGYTFALAMALMPLNGISDYRKFSICLPLDIDSNLSSQIYIITLISINTFSFLLLLSCYLRMYCAIRGSQAWNTNDLRIAKRMSILVITDFLCWMPIIIVACATLFGYHFIGTNGIKILTIFILPLNSVANPFLYAITTKKFKRDLNTLIRRTRTALNMVNTCCSQHSNQVKDPKVFIGYNEYQHNLMLSQKKKNKKHLANEFIKHQQQVMNKKHNNHKQAKERLNYHQMSQRPPFVHNTANQVTVNRTTCSCQRQQQQQHHQDTDQYANSITVQVNGQQRQSKPKIVLLSVEAGSLDNIYQNSFDKDSNDVRRSPSNEFTMLSLKQKPEQCNSNSANERYLMQPIDCDLIKSSQRHSEQSRPKSEEIGATISQPAVNCHVGSSCHAIIAEFDSHSGNSNEIVAGKQRYLNVMEKLVQQDQDRSASACGYSTTGRDSCRVTTKVASVGLQEVGTSQAHRGAKVCGSCDTMQIKVNNRCSERSSEKLSQSINRLLFSPIAKAWSSIQISLSSSASHVAAVAIGKQQSSSRLDNHEERSGTDATTPKKEATHNSTTIEEILLMSSPSRMRISERRMSRSCDLVLQQLPAFASPSSSMNGTTSQGEYDDDQRILLATINRIAANRESVKRRIVSQSCDVEDDVDGRECFNPTLNRCHEEQGYSRRFNRCRSWSPALLSKLEDCIHQIKVKIPGFNQSNQKSEDATTQDYGVAHEHMQSSQTDSSCCRETNDAVRTNIAPESAPGSDHNEDDYENDDDVGEEADADSGDIFDEKGLDEWTQKRKSLYRKQRSAFGQWGRLSRFQHQSSTNSDTLSTRTGTTVLTNMSFSFDEANSSNNTSGTTFTRPIEPVRSSAEDSKHNQT